MEALAAPRLLDRVRDKTRVEHDDIRTERASLDCIKRLIDFRGNRHPPEVEAYPKAPRPNVSLIVRSRRAPTYVRNGSSAIGHCRRKRDSGERVVTRQVVNAGVWREVIACRPCCSD